MLTELTPKPKPKATAKPKPKAKPKTRAVAKAKTTRVAKAKPMTLQIIEKLDLLEDLGWDYVLECVKNTKQTVAANGRVVDVLDRHIPTIDYFLRIWIPMKVGMPLIDRRTWYRWIQDEREHSHTIKNIDEQMKAVAIDIVANEAKGIFYAKNRLGMHDRQQIETKNVERFDFDN